jgi:hypothetical protein
MPRRGRRGPPARRVEQAKIDAKAAELAVQGLTMTQIAQRMGWKSSSSAKNAIDRHLALSSEPVNEALRRLWGQRIEKSVQVVWEAMHAENLVVSQGKVMEDPRTGEPLIDREPNVRAADTMMRLGERAARLWGLDAPKRSVQITVDMMRAELTELGSQLGFDDPLAVAQAMAEAQAMKMPPELPEGDEEVVEGEIVPDEGPAAA